jgi:ABC-type polysaccharide transport system permease subunit
MNPRSTNARTNITIIVIGAAINVGSDTITNIKSSINVIRANLITNIIITVVLRTGDFWMLSATGLPTSPD